MKTMAFILANIMLFALGVSSATSAPCGNEIDSLSKILAAKDAGSARLPVQPAAPHRPRVRRPNTRRPASCDNRLRAGRRLPKTFVVELKASRRPPSKEHLV